ncbi:MAG: DUF664 domain-containing protein [Chloroflexi bacterium]|nr:DUF664 domain-containing protein [Chloroflexota bacterium]
MTEIETYIRVLNGLHEELLNMLDGLDAEALDWRPPAPQANTIFVLATHILDSEACWIQEAIASMDTGSDNIAYTVSN